MGWHLYASSGIVYRLLQPLLEGSIPGSAHRRQTGTTIAPSGPLQRLCRGLATRCGPEVVAKRPGRSTSSSHVLRRVVVRVSRAASLKRMVERSAWWCETHVAGTSPTVVLKAMTTGATASCIFVVRPRWCNSSPLGFAVEISCPRLEVETSRKILDQSLI